MFRKTLITVLTLTAATLSAISISSQASAQGQGYIGLNITQFNYDESGIGDVDLMGASFVIGNKFNDYVALEARVTTGLGDDSVNTFIGSVDIEIDNVVGVYAKFGAPVSEMFNPYVLVGYTKAKATASINGFQDSAEGEDVSFGVGADIALTDVFSINLEWASYFDKDGGEIEGITLGTKFHL